MLSYHDAMSGVASHVLQAMAMALGADESYFADKFDRPASVIRIIRYPAVTQPPLPGQLRAGVHTDYGVMTFVRGDDTPGGLQVKHRQGDWIDVHIPPDAFCLQHRRSDDALVERPLGIDPASRRGAAAGCGPDRSHFAGLLPEPESRHASSAASKAARDRAKNTRRLRSRSITSAN